MTHSQRRGQQSVANTKEGKGETYCPGEPPPPIRSSPLAMPLIGCLYSVMNYNLCDLLRLGTSWRHPCSRCNVNNHFEGTDISTNTTCPIFLSQPDSSTNIIHSIFLSQIYTHYSSLFVSKEDNSTNSSLPVFL